jgi:hypothetical protein
MKERFEAKQKTYPDSFLRVDEWFKGVGNLRSLVAKEWLELTRSGSLMPAVGAYTVSLVAVYFIGWVFEKGFGIPLGFNAVFYSTLVGFLGVLTYSSLTSIEHNEYLNVMPVSVDSLVKAKLVIYFLITSGITLAYVVFIGLLRGEIILIAPSLIVAVCNSIYVVAVTAYLTGLWTNTMFFGAKTILKFSLLVMPPLIVIEIGTLMIPFVAETAMLLIVAACSIESAVSAYLLLRLKKKWDNASFSFISAG